MENARAEIMTGRRGKGTLRRTVRMRRGRSEKRTVEGKRRIERRASEAKWRAAPHPAGERRAPHFIAAASSLFIADTTLRHISLRIPRGIPRYVRWQRECESRARKRG